MIYAFNVIFSLTPFLMFMPTSIPQPNFWCSMSKELSYFLKYMV